MNSADLKLIPIDDLVDELFSRTEACVIAWVRSEDPGAPIVRHAWNYQDTGNLTAIGLVETLKHEMLEQFASQEES